MCNCSNVSYLKDAKFCHQCGDQIKCCVNCKVDLTCNDGNYCHLCGTRKFRMKVEEKCKSESPVKTENPINNDTQLLFLKKALIERWQENHSNVYLADILIKKLFKNPFKKSKFKCLNDIEDIRQLMHIWQGRRIVSTQQLIDEQANITRQRKGAMETQEKVAKSVMNFRGLKKVLEMEQLLLSRDS